MNEATPEERRADAVVHAVGLCVGLAAVPAMLVMAMASLPTAGTLSLAIYGTTLLAMLGFSAAYNLLRAPDWRSVLQRFDHAAIFLKIAGTYTPFAWVKIGGFAGYTLLGAVWIVALLGAAGKLFLGCN
jgi:hemolysin III